MFVHEYGCVVTEHDPERPWLVLGREHHTIKLPDDEQFFAWAAREWPRERYTCQLDPWALDPAE